jgi:hypothetical protein
MADVDGDFTAGQGTVSGASELDAMGDGDFTAGQGTVSGASELDAMGDGDFVAGQASSFDAAQPTGGTPQVSYLMRAHDDTLDETVFWTSQEVDGDGSDYAGPGPLSDVVMVRVVFTPTLA